MPNIPTRTSPPRRNSACATAPASRARSDQPRQQHLRPHGEGQADRGLAMLSRSRANAAGSPSAATPRIALADVANVDYNAASRAFLLRTRDGRHYVIVWLESREDAGSAVGAAPAGKDAGVPRGSGRARALRQSHARARRAIAGHAGRSSPSTSRCSSPCMFAGADLVQPELRRCTSASARTSVR